MKKLIIVVLAVLSALLFVCCDDSKKVAESGNWVARLVFSDNTSSTNKTFQNWAKSNKTCYIKEFGKNGFSTIYNNSNCTITNSDFNFAIGYSDEDGGCVSFNIFNLNGKTKEELVLWQSWNIVASSTDYSVTTGTDVIQFKKGEFSLEPDKKLSEANITFTVKKINENINIFVEDD